MGPPAFVPLDPDGHFVTFEHEGQQLVSTRDAYDHWFGLASGEQPEQAHLDELVKSADRIVVKATGQSRGRAVGHEIVVETSDRSILAELAAALRIGGRNDGGHCACLGGPVLELFAGERLLATIGVQHCKAIRWERWLPDAPLLDGARLDTWFRAQGILDGLLDRLYHNNYDQNPWGNVGYRRPGTRPLSVAEQRVRLLELERQTGFDEMEMFRSLNRELAADPTLALAYVVRGKLNNQLGRYDACVDDLARGRQHGILDATLMCERAVALHRLGRIEDAIADCSDAIAIAPTHAPAWNSRGLLLLERGHAHAALSDLGHAVDLAPRWMWPLINRARAHLALGENASAREDARRAEALLPPEVHSANQEETQVRRMIADLLR